MHADKERGTVFSAGEHNKLVSFLELDPGRVLYRCSLTIVAKHQGQNSSYVRMGIRYIVHFLRSKLWRFCSAALLSSLAFNGYARASVPDSPVASGDEQYKEVSKKILLDEVALARLNLSYRLEAARQGRWKGIRYSLSAVADSSLVESGLIVSVAERMSHRGGQLYKNLHAGALMHGNVSSL